MNERRNRQAECRPRAGCATKGSDCEAWSGSAQVAWRPLGRCEGLKGIASGKGHIHFKGEECELAGRVMRRKQSLMIAIGCGILAGGMALVGLSPIVQAVGCSSFATATLFYVWLCSLPISIRLGGATAQSRRGRQVIVAASQCGQLGPAKVRIVFRNESEAEEFANGIGAQYEVRE